MKTGLVPIGLALLVVAVANGLLSPDTKAKLIAFRWRHPLPGHRAFSKYAPQDPRVDLDALRRNLDGKLPTDPSEQNRTWYRLYKSVEGDPIVEAAHRAYLLSRDLTGLAILLLLAQGAAALFLVPAKAVLASYLLFLVLQLLLIRQSAINYGARFVANVLTLVSQSGPPPKEKAPRAPRKKVQDPPPASSTPLA